MLKVLGQKVHFTMKCLQQTKHSKFLALDWNPAQVEELLTVIQIGDPTERAAVAAAAATETKGQ